MRWVAAAPCPSWHPVCSSATQCTDLSPIWHNQQLVHNIFNSIQGLVFIKYTECIKCTVWIVFLTFFTTWRYASAVYASALCLSVCLSVHHKPVMYPKFQTAKHMIHQATMHNSQGVDPSLLCRRSWRNSNGITSTGVRNTGGVIIICNFPSIFHHISEMVQLVLWVPGKLPLSDVLTGNLPAS